jgi:hypothetical protein
MNQLPDDPFSVGRPFCYKVDPLQYTLYSVGPDLQDDGGTPIADNRRPESTRYNVTRNSKGDIVAGINR